MLIEHAEGSERKRPDIHTWRKNELIEDEPSFWERSIFSILEVAEAGSVLRIPGIPLKGSLRTKKKWGFFFDAKMNRMNQ